MAPSTVDRVTALVHDLNNLLDGSLRCVASAQKALDPASKEPDAIDLARSRIEVVRAALERMTEMVRAAMQPASTLHGISGFMHHSPITLAEAVSHAAEVLRPEAWQSRITIETAVTPDLDDAPAGAIYTILLNGLKNAIESIKRSKRGGRVLLRVGTNGSQPERKNGESATAIVIEIIDDGIGLKRPQDWTRAFEPGYSTKPTGMGLGLALAREIIASMGGVIELVPRPAGPGAILRLTYPRPRQQGNGAHAA